MQTVELSMTFKNCGSSKLELYLEPNADLYFVEPNQKVMIHAICLPTVKNTTMHVEWHSDGVQIYEPGLGSQCVEFYVSSDGVRLPIMNRG